MTEQNVCVSPTFNPELISLEHAVWWK
jgi:hypothetical protein